MTDLIKRADNSWMLMGLLGAACGPMAAPGNDTGAGETETTSTSTDPTTTAPTSDPSDPSNPSDPSSPSDPSDPTVGTDPSDPTMGTDPMPECQSDADCGDVYCGYCIDGVCEESPGCCGGGYATPAHAKGWRCQPYFECYTDAECEYNEACEFNECMPVPVVGLGPCKPLSLSTSEWNLSQSPGAFVLADLDGDMDLDLAVAEPGVAQIELALNDGAGAFKLAGAFPVGLPSEHLALAAGDLDLDGDIDLVAARREDGILTLLFGQDAVFTPGVPVSSINSFDQVAIADVDDDGLPDLVGIGAGSGSVSIWRGEGKGIFASELGSSLTDGGAPFASLVEMTGQSPIDLLLPVPATQSVAVYRGSPDGFAELVTFGDHTPPNAVYGADLDTQLDPGAFPDVVSVRAIPGGGAATVWRGKSVEAWEAVPTVYSGAAPLLGGAMVAFEDHDGVDPNGEDLVMATGQASLAIWPGNDLGGFACERTIPLSAATAPELIAVGDVDGDGLRDIVAGHVQEGTVTVLRQLP